MIINEQLISYLEDLSCLIFTDDEKIGLTKDLKEILNSMEQLCSFNAEDVPERSHPFEYTNAFRSDDVQVSFERECILKNAPERDDESFVVPKTVGGGISDD